MAPLLEVRNLRTQFRTDDGIVKAVDDVSFTIHEKEIVGVVGESGCGKSVTRLSVMRLIRPPGQIVEGEVPSPLNPPEGCSFHPRCSLAIERCKERMPETREARPGHFVACMRAEEKQQ